MMRWRVQSGLTNMVNAIRGECEVTFAGKTHAVALTMATLAELESAFGVDWDQIDPLLFRRENVDGREVPIPRVAPLHKFWRTAFRANKLDPGALDAPGISPYDLLREAMRLIATSREAWFGNDREPDQSADPLSVAPAGALGSA